MRVFPASFEILDYPRYPLQMIEKAGRTCYKSEDRITEDSAKEFVRRLIKNDHLAMIEFGGTITVKFTSNRGFTHEAVRHRLASFAQSSTRYCNYSLGKFGKEIVCTDPAYVLTMTKLSPEDQAWAKAEMMEVWLRCEESYMRLIERGVPAELARDVLPIGLEAELVIAANLREWRHVFELRTSGKAHPRMRELMIPLWRALNDLVPVVFEDLEP